MLASLDFAVCCVFVLLVLDLDKVRWVCCSKLIKQDFECLVSVLHFARPAFIFIPSYQASHLG
jgi:hypothetical protein